MNSRIWAATIDGMLSLHQRLITLNRDTSNTSHAPASNTQDLIKYVDQFWM